MQFLLFRINEVSAKILRRCKIEVPFLRPALQFTLQYLSSHAGKWAATWNIISIKETKVHMDSNQKAKHNLQFRKFYLFRLAN